MGIVSKILKLLITFVFCVAFGIFLYITTTRYNLQLKSSTFSKTNATVVESRIAKILSEQSWRREVPYVRYEYTIRGSQYQSSEYKFFGSFVEDFTSNDDALRNYPIGKQIEIYFNPENPSEALINNSPPKFSDLIFWYIVLTLIGFIWVVLLFYKGRRITNRRT